VRGVPSFLIFNVELTFSSFLPFPSDLLSIDFPSTVPGNNLPLKAFRAPSLLFLSAL
jgi:hypothetical protein